MAAPKSMLLSELLRDVVRIDAQVTIKGVALDSRQVRPGYLFAALSGISQSGHNYINDAIAAGAVAVIYDASVAVAAVGGVVMVAVDDLGHKVGLIAERFFAEPSRNMQVIGVTGTNGKTSCSQFLAQAMNDELAPSAVIGTLGNGLWGQLDVATHTTPDAVTLHGLMADFCDKGARSLTMEVSSHALDQGRVAGVLFDVAVFTNLSHDHLDYHGDMATYGQAKGPLFSSPGLRQAVINIDDAFGRQLLADIPASVEVICYSLNDAQPVRGQLVTGHIVHLGPEGLTLEVKTPWGDGRFNSPLLGRFNAANVLAVLAVLLGNGVEFNEALARMAQLNTVAGRMERFGGGNAPLVVVDYAHTPDALEHVLKSLREHCGGKLWCVFGCGGDRDKAKRPLMGGIAERLADRVVITDDNPRSEDSKEIINDIVAGVQASMAVEVIADRQQAIAHVIGNAAANDLVLIAGKGHETYQQVGSERIPFSDREQVELALEAAA